MTISASLEPILKHSFRNFHVNGFDYVCLQRSDVFTLKAYFFDEAHDDIVMPHNHRYDFTSTVLKGRLTNHRYNVIDNGAFGFGKRANKFAYFTPLNGGDGFHFQEEVWLKQGLPEYYWRGGTCYSSHEDIHTISVEEGTVLLLTQFVDRVGIATPTDGYRFDSKEPPKLEGLYEPFKESELINRLVQLQALGIRI